MKNFKVVAKFLGVLFLIFVCFIALFEIVLYRLQETWPYDKVLSHQIKYNSRYATRYFDQGIGYKFSGVHKFHPEVLVLGTSRVLQLRKDLQFNNSYYNAAIVGSMSQGLNGMRRFVSSFDESYTPQHLIISIDPWLLNPNYPENKMELKDKIIRWVERFSVTSYMYRAYKLFKQRRLAYKGFLQEEENIFKYFWDDYDDERIGVNARMFDTGFGVDGSYFYPEDYLNRTEKLLDVEKWKKALSKNNYRFPPAKDVDNKAVIKLEKILEMAEAKKIKVTGVLMPLRGDFYHALTTILSHKEYIVNSRKETCAAFEKFNFVCFDFTNPSSLNLAHNDFLDKLHAKDHVLRQVAAHIF